MKKYLCFCLYFISGIAFAQQSQLIQERSYKTSADAKFIATSAGAGNGNILYSGATLVGTYDYINHFLQVQPNTDTLWVRKGSVNLENYNQALQTTSDGGHIFFGAIDNPNRNSPGVNLYKLNAAGLPQWTQNNFFNNTSNIPFTALVMPDKGYLVGGLFQNFNFSFWRTDSLGNTKWIKRYARTGPCSVYDMKFTRNGNIIAAGNTGGNASNTWHPRLLLLNQNGDTLKDRQFQIRGYSDQEGMWANLNSITPLSDGGFLYTGYSDTATTIYPNGTDMGMLVKLDSSLNVKWSYIHRTPNVDGYVFSKAKELADSTIVVLAFNLRPGSGVAINKFELFRFRPNGTLKDVYSFTSSICSDIQGFTLDALADSSFMVGGRCRNSNSYGFYVAKVKVPGLPPVMPPFTITATKEELLLAGTSLGQSYPNPTAAEATIPYSLPKNYSKASIMIREIATGREIRKYDLKRNSSSLTVEVGSLSSGLYLYSLVVDEKPIATKKLAVMK